MFSGNKDHFIFFFSDTIYVSRLTVLARNSYEMFNRKGERRIPCLFPILKRKNTVFDYSV